MKNAIDEASLLSVAATKKFVMALSKVQSLIQQRQHGLHTQMHEEDYLSVHCCSCQQRESKGTIVKK